MNDGVNVRPYLPSSVCHGCDRDLSFGIREAGLRCVVVNAPFIHRGGGTRTAVSSASSVSADLAERHTALARFAGSGSTACHVTCDRPTNASASGLPPVSHSVDD
jgi:hypothetical protein